MLNTKLLCKYDLVRAFKKEARGGHKVFPTPHLEEWSLEKGSSRKPCKLEELALSTVRRDNLGPWKVYHVPSIQRSNNTVASPLYSH